MEVSSKVHGNPLNQSIIYKQCGISLKGKNAKPDYAAEGEVRTSKSSGRVVWLFKSVRWCVACVFFFVLWNCSVQTEHKGRTPEWDGFPTFHLVSLSSSPCPLSLFPLKRQSKAIITTSASAKLRLFWCGGECGEPLLISLSLCRGAPIRPDSTLCNEGLGIKAAMERSAPLWSHCGWSPVFSGVAYQLDDVAAPGWGGKCFIWLLVGLAVVMPQRIEL